MKKLISIIAGIITLASIAYAADRVIINPDQDGDLKLKVNDGGVVKDVITITGATSLLSLGATNETGTHTVNGVLGVGSASQTASFVANFSGSGNTHRGLQIRANAGTIEADDSQTSSGGGFIVMEGVNDGASAGYDFLVAKNTSGRQFHVRGDGQLFAKSMSSSGTIVTPAVNSPCTPGTDCGVILSAPGLAGFQAITVQCHASNSGASSRCMSFCSADSAGADICTPILSVQCNIAATSGVIDVQNTGVTGRTFYCSYIRNH